MCTLYVLQASKRDACAGSLACHSDAVLSSHAPGAWSARPHRKSRYQLLRLAVRSNALMARSCTGYVALIVRPRCDCRDACADRSDRQHHVDKPTGEIWSCATARRGESERLCGRPSFTHCGPAQRRQGDAAKDSRSHNCTVPDLASCLILIASRGPLNRKFSSELGSQWRPRPPAEDSCWRPAWRTGGPRCMRLRRRLARPSRTAISPFTRGLATGGFTSPAPSRTTFRFSWSGIRRGGGGPFACTWTGALICSTTGTQTRSDRCVSRPCIALIAAHTCLPRAARWVLEVAQSRPQSLTFASGKGLWRRSRGGRSGRRRNRAEQGPACVHRG